MFALTFGSFGDILAAAQLASQIAKALSDSAGSSWEYQYLIAELDSLSLALKLADNAVLVLSSNISCQNTVDSLQADIAKCRLLMEKFLDRIKVYQKSLGKGGSGSSWRKIGWGLFRKEDIADLRKKLSTHKATIILFLISSTCNILVRSGDEERGRYASIQTFLNRIDHNLQQMSRTIGFTADNGLRFIDALGADMILPMQLCATWESFDAVIKIRFKHLVGNQYVERGDYDIIHGGNLVIPEEWTNVVKAGTTIEMSIILRLQSAQDKHKCPRCRTVNTGATSSECWIDCRRCEGRFQVSEVLNSPIVEGGVFKNETPFGDGSNKENYVDDADDEDGLGGPPSINTGKNLPRTRTGVAREHRCEDDEATFFRRIHLFLPLAPPLGPFIPQSLYRPHTSSDRRRYVEEVKLEAPIAFQLQNPPQAGIPLRDALTSSCMRLVGRDDAMFVDRGPSIAIRLQWEGYQPWSRQIPTRDFRSLLGPITRSKVAKNVAKSVARFIGEHQGRPVERDADPRWQVGTGLIELDDLILVSLHHVSMGSWQVNLRLARPQARTPLDLI